MFQKKLGLKNSWHFLCHKTEVSKKNSFINISYEGIEIFAVNENGVINVFENMCLHRGSKLVEGKSGMWNKKCPYHGVCYEDGFPINLAEKGLIKSKERIRLNKFQAAEVGDFIFFTDEQNIQDVKSYLGKNSFKHLSDISNTIECLLSDTEYTYDCRWEVAVENALEPLHLEDIHPETLNTLNLGPSVNQESRNSIIFNHSINNSSMLKGLNKIQKFFKYKFSDSYHSTYVFPFLFVSSTFGFSFSIQTFFPANDKFKTHFRSRVYESKLADKSKRSLLKTFFESSLDINRLIFEEDAEICSKIVKTENHFIGPIADTEEKILWFRKRLRK